MNVVMTIREQRELTHENRRRDLLLRSYRYASVSEVNESNECAGRCFAFYDKKIRVVQVVGDCAYHRRRS